MAPKGSAPEKLDAGTIEFVDVCLDAMVRGAGENNHRILSIVKWLMTYSWFINVSLLVPMYSWCLIYNWLVLWNMNFIFPYTVLGML